METSLFYDNIDVERRLVVPVYPSLPPPTSLEIGSVAVVKNIPQPGNDAFVVDAGTFYLLFTGTGPQGFQGPQGLQGIIGTVGAQGLQGSQGSQGSQGIQGLQGNVGGTQGNQGFQGSQGIRGVQGAQGNQGIGTQGNQGSQGNQGTSIGNQGFQGFQGAGAQGFQGTQGIGTGPQGVPGSNGSQGPQGAQGNQGFQGFRGTQGNPGFQGQQGTTPGAQGAQGSGGSTGFQGLFNPPAYAEANVNYVFSSSGGGTTGGIVVFFQHFGRVVHISTGNIPLTISTGFLTGTGSPPANFLPNPSSGNIVITGVWNDTTGNWKPIRGTIDNGGTIHLVQVTGNNTNNGQFDGGTSNIIGFSSSYFSVSY
jgi:hypothetical protein